MIIGYKIILSLVVLASVMFFLKPTSHLNFWLVSFVFIESSLLFIAHEFNRKVLIRKSVLMVASVFLTAFIVMSGIYKDTFKVTNFEKNQLWARQELYRRELGVFGRSNFGNKSIETVKLVFDKINQKVTEPYELSYYFSSEDCSFYPLLLLPLFFLGFIFLLASDIRLVFFYLILATMGVILVPPDMAYWLLVPLINLGIMVGVRCITNLAVSHKK